jgi:radical SAM superfamily enzyme YgiQ (UPF0313 family)
VFKRIYSILILIDMSLLLIRPGHLKPYKYNFMKHFSLKYPPLNLTVLANQAENVKILDLSIFKDPQKMLVKTLEKESFDFIGITVVTPFMDEVNALVGIAREHSNGKVILGGPHITALPKESLLKSKADIACVGEGETTLKEISSGKPLSRVKGAAYFKKGKFVLNHTREFIKNLDKLELPRWDLIRTEKYFTLFSKKNPTCIIETSRGCPYDCIFCHKQTFGKVYRTKTPGRVVDEMEHALGYGFKEIHIIDDAFSVSKERVLRICKEIRKRKLDIPWSLPCGIRVDQADQELFDNLYSAGCHMVAFGVESGSDRILRNIDKGISRKQIKKAFKYARNAGIETLIALLMVGLPGETAEDMKATIEFAKELDAGITKVSVTVPYPGTRLYEKYKKDNMLSKEFSWSSYRMHNPEKIYEHEILDWADIKRGYDEVLRAVYMNPRHYTCRLKKIMGSYFPRFVRNYIYGIRNGV